MDSANNIKKNNLLMCIEMSDNDQYKQNTVNLKNDYLNNMNPFLSNSSSSSNLYSHNFANYHNQFISPLNMSM